MAENQSPVDAVVDAVIAALKADATVVGLTAASPVDGTAGVYEEAAPEEAGYDYMVVNQAGAVPANTCGRGWGWAVLVYVRATCRTRAAAKSLASRAIALLDYPATPLVAGGYETVLSETVSDGPGYPEPERGDTIHHHPVAIRVTVHGLAGSS